MLIDLYHAPPDIALSAEILIVGSGAVGLAMAARLARAGRDVLVLEAGGRNLEPQSQAFFQAARWRHRRLEGLHLGRYRALGGTTNFWGGQLARFDPLVFEHRPWVADAGWPVTAVELDPYYELGYEMLGVGHYLEDEAVWRRLKMAPAPADEALDHFFSVWAPKTNFAALFREEINTSRRLSVVVNAPVVALSMDDARTCVTSAVVRAPGGIERRFTAESVILANGTIETARLLRLPLADGRAAPWSGNPWLGKGFVDHIDARAGSVVPMDGRRFHDLFDNVHVDGIKYMPKLKLSDKAQREKTLLGISGFFIFNSHLSEHLASAKILARSLLKGRFGGRFLAGTREALSAARVAVPMIVRYLRHRRMYHPADQGIEFFLMSEQLPIRESALHLMQERDALGMPLVEMDWRLDGREIETLATFTELVAAYLERHGLAHLDIVPALKARDPAFLEQTDEYYHHMGMARMGRSPVEGVVDRDLLVFGTRNLHVVGAAVYPTTGQANPTLTAIALGLRLAEAISREAWRAPARRTDAVVGGA
jgi:hypothetical protein